MLQAPPRVETIGVAVTHISLQQLGCHEIKLHVQFFVRRQLRRLARLHRDA